jgi:hypothetical protein
MTTLIDCGVFGGGMDGDVIINNEVTIVRPMCYNNLTITQNGVLNANGCIICVKDTCQIDGEIRNKGGDADGQIPGKGTAVNILGGGSDGGKGGDYLCNGENGVDIKADGNGGSGGKGGNNGIYIGGTGGVLTPTTYAEGSQYVMAVVPYIVNCRNTSGDIIMGGSGGGGGAGGKDSLGGAGGGGGGIISLCACIIRGNGRVVATGGDGGDSSGYNAGGGAGGGGGIISLMTSRDYRMTGNVSMEVSGGLGGTGSGNGVTGENGASGFIFNYVI